MKAIIKFNLPEEQDEFEMFNQASAMHSVLWDLTQWLRGQTKYAPENTEEDTIKAFYDCQDKLNELLYSNRIEL